MINQVEYQDKIKWRSIIEEFEQKDIYYCPEYIEAFRRNGDGTPILIYGKHKKTKFCNVVMKRNITPTDDYEVTEWGDFTTPYGYGGILIQNPEEEAVKVLQEQYSEFCVNNNVVCEFVRFHPVTQNYQWGSRFYDIELVGPTISINLSSNDKIWENLESKNRNMIRKALKNDVKIYWGRSPELFSLFHQMYDETMRRDEAKEYYYFNNSFYESILNDLRNNAAIFYACFEEKIIAMAIILMGNRQLHYHLSASIREYSNLAPTNLLLYEASVWGAQNGFKTFHLGGGLGGKEDSLYHFKKGFNRKSDTKFYVGKQIYDREKYNYLCNRVGGEDNGYFPSYRVPR